MIKPTAHLLRDIVEVKIILELIVNNLHTTVIVYTQVVIMHQHPMISAYIVSQVFIATQIIDVTPFSNLYIASLYTHQINENITIIAMLTLK